MSPLAWGAGRVSFGHRDQSFNAVGLNVEPEDTSTVTIKSAAAVLPADLLDSLSLAACLDMVAPATQPSTAAGQERTVVLDYLVPWEGPQRPRPPRSRLRRIVMGRQHRHALRVWERERREWIEAGRPPRRQRMVIPHARIEHTEDAGE